MVMHTNAQQSPGPHFAVVDSGTSMHILQHRLFTSNLSEDHTAVSGFSGNTSRATHRFDFNCVVREQNGGFIYLADPSTAPSHSWQPQKHLICAPRSNSLDTPSYWEHKPDYYYTVIPNSSFRSSKTNPPASGFYLCYHHRSHTMVSIQSTTLSHHQDKPKEMTKKIQIKASFMAAQAYHFPWYLTTVSQRQLCVLQNQQLEIKIEQNF